MSLLKVWRACCSGNKRFNAVAAVTAVVAAVINETLRAAAAVAGSATVTSNTIQLL